MTICFTLWHRWYKSSMLNSTENCFRNIVAMRSVSYTNCFAMSLYLIDYLIDAKTVLLQEEPLAPLAASCLVSNLKSYLRDGVVAPAASRSRIPSSARAKLSCSSLDGRRTSVAIGIAFGPSSPESITSPPQGEFWKLGSHPSPIAWWDICTNLFFRC